MKKSTLFSGAALSLGVSIFATSAAFAAPVNTAFTDDNFYKCVISASNLAAVNGGNGTNLSESDNITDQQLASIKTLACDGLGAEESAKVSNIAGIEKMTGLTQINLGHHNIAVADFSHNTSLKTLTIDHNKLTSLVLPSSAESVQAHHNDTSASLSINAANATSLTYLDVENSKLTLPLDLSSATALTQMKVNHTNIDVLDLTHNPAIRVVQNFGMDDLVLKVDVDYAEVPATDSTPAAYTIDISRIYGDNLLISDTNPYLNCGESECTFDSSTKKITIKSPTKVKGSIQVDAYNIYVPLTGDDLDVPPTSTGIEEEEKKENPDTSTSDKLVLGLSVLGIALLGLAVKAAASAKRA